MSQNNPIKVKRRVNWKDRSAPPCTMVDEYSIDGGKTWMSSGAFHQWHNSLIEIEPLPSAEIK